MKHLLSILFAVAATACGDASTGQLSAAAQPAAAVQPAAPTSPGNADALRSWNDGAARPAIVEFVGLQWAMAGPGARFALFVHHDDAAREFAYDRTDKLQKFNAGWDEAVAKGWTVVGMQRDWKTVFPAAGQP